MMHTFGGPVFCLHCPGSRRMGPIAGLSAARRTTIEALRLVPIIASYATDTGLPRQPMPAPACDAASWVCRSEPWKRIVDAVAVRGYLSCACRLRGIPA